MRDYSFLTEIEDDDLRMQAMRELAKTDLYWLCRYVLNYRKMETRTNIHYSLCDELDKIPGGEAKRLLVLVFRGAFKTSIGLAKCIQWMINDPSCQIGLGSDTKERAADRVKDLRDVIQNNSRLKALFPEVFHEDPENQSDLWTADAFNVKRPDRGEREGGFSLATVTAFGLDPLPTGSHFTHVLLDDVENDYNQKNDAQIEKLNKNLSLFTPIPQVHAPIIMLGTIYSKHGPNTRFQSKWRTYKCPIVDKYGEPTFPSLYGKAEIKRIHEEAADEWTWMGQYLLKAADRTDRYLFPFRGKKFKYGRYSNGVIYRDGHQIKLDESLIYVTIDPSGGANEEQGRQNKKLDKVGVCVNAVDLAGKWFILDLWKRYLDDDQFIDMLFQIDEQWKPYLIGIEKMPHLDKLIRDAIRTRNQSLHVSELKPNRRKKADRIRALLPILGDITFNETLMGTEATLQGWHTEVEHGDDDWDALAYQIDIARKPERGIIGRKRLEDRKRDDKQRLSELPEHERKEWERWLKLEEDGLETNIEAKVFQDELADFYGETIESAW